MSTRSRLLVVLALLVGLVGVVVSFVSTPVLQALTSGLVPALLEVPRGALLFAGDGSRVPVLESVSSVGVDVLRLPVLLPGVYFLWAPAGSLAGALAPVSAPVTLVASTGPVQLPDAFGLGALVLLVAIVGLGALAGLRTGWLSRVLLGASLVLLAAWAAWGHPDGLPAVTALVGLFSVVSVVLGFVAVAPSRLRALVVAGLLFVAAGVNPVTSVVVLALLLAAVLVVSGLVRQVVILAVVLVMAGAGLQAFLADPAPVDGPRASAAQCMAIGTGGATPSAERALTSAEYADCWRALGVSLVQGRSLAEATAELRRVLEGVGDMPKASACHVAGDAMTAQFAREADGVGELAALAASMESVCDFNGPHGFAIGAFVGVPEVDWERRAVEVCGVPGPKELPEMTWVTQCWHGVGQAVARESGFDVAAVERVCALAPSPGDRGNCGEGLFADALDERVEHFDNVAGSHLAVVGSLPELCARASTEVGPGCFRYVGAEFGSGDKHYGRIAKGVREVCASQVSGSVKERQCWWGFGSVLANNPPVREFEVAKEHLLSWCGFAPSVVSESGCIVRGLANLVSIELSEGRPIDIEPLCGYLSGPFKETDCAGLVNLPNTIVGKGHSF